MSAGVRGRARRGRGGGGGERGRGRSEGGPAGRASQRSVHEARREQEKWGRTGGDVLVNHLPQLARKLDAGRSAAADDKAEELLALVLLGRGEGRLFEVVHDAAADGLGVLDRLELEAVLEAGDAVRRVDRAARDDELVVGDVEVVLVLARDLEEAGREVDVDRAANDRCKCVSGGIRGRGATRRRDRRSDREKRLTER